MPMIGEHDGDEQELACLDAQVEEQQRDRDVALRQPDLAQGAGEAEAVQQPERERHDPGHPRARPDPPVTRVHDLGGDEHDAERDHRLDRLRRHVDEAERRERRA